MESGGLVIGQVLQCCLDLWKSTSVGVVACVVAKAQKPYEVTARSGWCF